MQPVKQASSEPYATLHWFEFAIQDIGDHRVVTEYDLPNKHEKDVRVLQLLTEARRAFPDLLDSQVAKQVRASLAANGLQKKLALTLDHLSREPPLGDGVH